MLGLALLRMAILVCSSSFRNAEIQMNNPFNMHHDMLGFAPLHIAILNSDIEMNSPLAIVIPFCFVLHIFLCSHIIY